MIIKQYGAWIFVFSPLEKKFLWISTDLKSCCYKCKMYKLDIAKVSVLK